MKSKILLGARVLLGLIMVVFGLNGFLQFIPIPPPNEAMGSFMGALMQSGYFFPLLKVTEIVTGVMLLANLAAPLAFVILAPIVVHIVAVHVFLDPGGMPMAIFLVVLMAVLGIGHFASFRPLFKRF